MGEREILAAYCEAIARTEPPDDDALEAILLAGGHGQAAAQWVVQLGPLAFGRKLLAGLVRCHPEYIVLDADGGVLKRGLLAEDPTFAAASQAADQRPELVRIAGLRSSEVNAVNSALHAGSKPENLVLGPAIIFTSPPTAAGRAAAQRLLQAEIAAARSHTPPPVEGKKPWWKPWRT